MNTRRLRVVLMVGILSSVAVTANAQSGPEPQRLTLAEAQKIIDTAHKAAADMNLRLSIAVVDARGDLIALGRMPGAGAGTTDTAREGTTNLSKLVKEHGFKTSYREIPGRHYWFLWRDFLGEFAQVMFQ